MTEREKIAVADLRSRGFRKSSCSPPLYRILWKLGILVPPPHFSGFFTLFLVQGGFFAIIMVPFGFLLDAETPITTALTVSGIAGVAFGGAMATLLRLQAWWFGLPRWADYEPGEPEEELW